MKDNLPTLDLHHLSHKEAGDIVIDYINFLDPPFQIITGKSEKMRNIVIEIIKDYGWAYHDQYFDNYGCLVIMEGD
tara:strand:+ start:180 stop:407 length:228 start_codon:yes stop_codon:yes gene_type:complete